MKVDLPQPESAATPIINGTSPGLRAICSGLLEVTETRTFDLGIKALGAKADTAATLKATTNSFMVRSILGCCDIKSSFDKDRLVQC
jgi:hypothetical protein